MFKTDSSAICAECKIEMDLYLLLVVFLQNETPQI